MRKRVILAFVLVLALLATSGCSLIVKDEEVDRATPVIEVAGKVFTKGEVQAQTDYLLNYYESMYASYGMAFDRTDPQMVADARQSAIDSLINSAVINQKLAERGYDQLTPEERATIDAKVDENYQVYYDTVLTFYMGPTELEGEELDAAVEAQMVALGFPTREQLAQSEEDTFKQNKLRADVVKDVTVTEEEFQAEYHARVETATASYVNTPAAFGTAVSNRETIYYTPAGYRFVKHILVSFSAEDQAAIEAIESELLYATDEEAIAEINGRLEAAKTKALAGIQAQVDEVSAKIAAGEDFNGLITAYNTDPGMTAESTGYAVSSASTNWVPEFQAASMALENVGDVSGPVVTRFGVHFIKFESEAVEGPVDPEAVRDVITAELLTAKQDEVYAATVAQWVTEANAKVDTSCFE